MENYIRVARTHVALACLYGVITLVFVAMAVAGQFSDKAPMFAVVALMAAIAAGHWALSVGARKRSGVSKVISMIVGLLMLPAFPLGTMIGAYLLWNAATEWVEPRTYGPGLADGWPVPPTRDADAPPA